MKKQLMSIFLGCLIVLTGCNQYDSSAIVVTADLAGISNESVSLINTDDLTQAPVSLPLGNMDLPNMVLTSPDSTKAYVASAHYPLLTVGGNSIKVIDVKTKTISNTITVNHDLLTGVFDMALNPSGTRLYVGTWSVVRAYIDIYDTSTMERIGGFDTDQTTGLFSIDYYRWCWKLAVHPSLDVVYVLAADAINARVRAYSTTDGSLLGGQEYAIDWCGIENLMDYKIAIAPQGDLLLALSSKTFPFQINTDGSLSVLYDTDSDGQSEGIDWQGSDQATLYGNTDILFTKSKGTIYINSAGIHLGSINIAGGSVCMSKTKILAQDANPYIYSLTNFVDDILPAMAKQLGYGAVSDIIDSTKLYGVSASVMVDNTCFMFIAPVISMDTQGVSIPNILAVFESVFTGATPLWIGGATTTTYANNMAVNPAKDTVCLTNKWANSVDVYNKDLFFGWFKMTKKGSISLGAGVYPQAIGMSSLLKVSQ